MVFEKMRVEFRVCEQGGMSGFAEAGGGRVRCRLPAPVGEQTLRPGLLLLQRAHPAERGPLPDAVLPLSRPRSERPREGGACVRALVRQPSRRYRN